MCRLARRTVPALCHDSSWVQEQEQASRCRQQRAVHSNTTKNEICSHLKDQITDRIKSNNSKKLSNRIYPEMSLCIELKDRSNIGLNDRSISKYFT